MKDILVNVFARIAPGLAENMRSQAAREGRTLRVIVADALQSFDLLASDENAARAAIRRYAVLLAKAKQATGVSLQVAPDQKDAIGRLAGRLQVKKQIVYGAALMAYSMKGKRRKPKPGRGTA